MEKKKVICTGWIGRFGNRCHSYLYGKHIEDKFGAKFYVPASGWDGEVIFKNPAPKYDSNFSKCSFTYAGGSYECEDFEKNKKTLDAYNKKFNDDIEFIDPCLQETYGKTNIAYNSLVTDVDWFFRKIKLSEIKKYFEFSDELKNTDMFKEFEDKQGTYDVAHFRRTDIARASYVGGHSMVSERSYWDAFDKFDVDRNKVIWVSDEKNIGYSYEGKIPILQGRQISWLPDFLKLVFARNMFRSNSSFSVWAGWIGNSNVFSPWLHEYCPGKEKDFEFVEGNHPHWMAVKGVHSCYEFNIKNDLKEKPKMNSQTKTNKLVIKSSPKNEKGKLIMVHWNGRFGNRVFSYMYGRSYAEKGGLDFYIPSEWEGTRLFKDDGYKIIDDDELRLAVNQTMPQFDNIDARGDAVGEYNRRKNCNIRYVNADHAREFGSPNRWFDSLCVHSCEVFSMYSEKKMLKWFEFTDEVKNLDIYKRLEDKQGTYDIAHLRRDDISCPQYNQNNPQNYSVISKNAYLKTFDKFGFDPNKVEWTTDDWSGKWGVGKPEHKAAGWTYPVGSHDIPDIIFDWLPDFLRLYFARTIFRANSSFSWVAAFLSPTAEVYSPVLGTRKIYKGEKDEVEYEFVKGNHPHWFNYKGHSCSEIVFGP